MSCYSSSSHIKQLVPSFQYGYSIKITNFSVLTFVTGSASESKQYDQVYNAVHFSAIKIIKIKTGKQFTINYFPKSRLLTKFELPGVSSKCHPVVAFSGVADMQGAKVTVPPQKKAFHNILKRNLHKCYVKLSLAFQNEDNKVTTSRC